MSNLKRTVNPVISKILHLKTFIKPNQINENIYNEIYDNLTKTYVKKLYYNEGYILKIEEIIHLDNIFIDNIELNGNCNVSVKVKCLIFLLIEKTKIICELAKTTSIPLYAVIGYGINSDEKKLANKDILLIVTDLSIKDEKVKPGAKILCEIKNTGTNLGVYIGITKFITFDINDEELKEYTKIVTNFIE